MGVRYRCEFTSHIEAIEWKIDIHQSGYGGGVTTLESLAVCTPVITFPMEQTVVSLAAGQLRSLSSPTKGTNSCAGIGSDTNSGGVRTTGDGDNFSCSADSSLASQIDRWLVVKSASDYIANSNALLGPDSASISEELLQLRKGICLHSHRLYATSDAVTDWTLFLQKQLLPTN